MSKTHQSFSALTGQRKEEWRTEAADVPPYETGSDVFYQNRIDILSIGILGQTPESGRGVLMLQ